MDTAQTGKPKEAGKPKRKQIQMLDSKKIKEYEAKGWKYIGVAKPYQVYDFAVWMERD